MLKAVGLCGVASGSQTVAERKGDGFNLSHKSREPLMHMAPVARVCHQMLRLRLGWGNG